MKKEEQVNVSPYGEYLYKGKDMNGEFVTGIFRDPIGKEIDGETDGKIDSWDRWKDIYI